MSNSSPTPEQPQSVPAPTLRSSLQVVARIFAVPVLVLAFILAIALVVEGLRREEYIDGRFFAVVLIGCLGGLGGSVAAAQDGVLNFPSYDGVSRSIRLGSLQESMFGAVGAYAIFLVMPGISEQALRLGETAFDSKSPAAARAGDAKESEAPSVDWIELIAIALIGGYAGRAIITRAMLLYVTKEDVENAKQEVRQESTEMVSEVQAELESVVAQREHDHEALKLFHDQADIYTNPPPLEALLSGMKAASSWVLADIYVEARRTFHSIVSMSELTTDKDKAAELQRRIAERMIPVMQCLCELDQERKYRGSRYGLALALHLIGRSGEALLHIKEAIVISRATSRPVPTEYEELLRTLESADSDEPAPGEPKELEPKQ